MGGSRRELNRTERVMFIIGSTIFAAPALYIAYLMTRGLLTTPTGDGKIMAWAVVVALFYGIISSWWECAAKDFLGEPIGSSVDRTTRGGM